VFGIVSVNWFVTKVKLFEFFFGQVHELVGTHFVGRFFGIVFFNFVIVFGENCKSVGFGIIAIAFAILGFPGIEFVSHVV
jgi:hypothetical protein